MKTRIFCEYSRRFFHRCTQMKTQMFTDKTSVLISVSYQGSSVEGSFCFPGTQIPADLRDFLRLFHAIFWRIYAKGNYTDFDGIHRNLHGAWGKRIPRILTDFADKGQVLRDLASSLFTFYFLLPTEKGMGHGASHPRILATSLFTFYFLLPTENGIGPRVLASSRLRFLFLISKNTGVHFIIFLKNR